MNLGKYLERLSLSVDFLLYRLFSDKIENDSLKENIYWKNLLLSIGGYQTYKNVQIIIFNTKPS